MGNVIWTPQPRQAALMARFEDEALYGGAAGGGKSDCALAEALRQVEIPWAYPPQDLPAAHGADGPQHGDLQTGLQKGQV